MTGSKHALKERMQNIHKRPKSLFAVTLIVMLCAAVAGLAACSSPTADTPNSTVQETYVLPGNTADDPTYSLSHIGADGAVLSSISPDLDGSALAEQIIMNAMVKSSALPGVDLSTLGECYLIRQSFASGEAHDYYAFTVSEGAVSGAVLQSGTDGMYTRIDDALYEKLSQYMAEHSLKTSAGVPSTQKAFDRTTMRGAAEEFLTRYFDDMCAGDTDWGWDGSAQYDGLIAYTDAYNKEICILKQWIAHKAFLAEDDYNIERDMGQFSSLEEVSVPMEYDLPDVEYVFGGYFRTTAFGTYVLLGMNQTAGGNYTIVTVAFPDWTEYNNFHTDFIAYIEQVGCVDYNKSLYIDYLRKAKQASIAEREAWKSGEVVSRPFAIHRSLIQLSGYSATLNSNGAVAHKPDASDDYFARENDAHVCLTVDYVPRGTRDVDVDLVQCAIDSDASENCELYGAVEYDPTTFFGDSGTPVRRLLQLNGIQHSTRSAMDETRIYTIYYAQLTYEGEDTVLIFRFENAHRGAQDRWLVSQREVDCEQWMQTLRFAA